MTNNEHLHALRAQYNLSVPQILELMDRPPTARSTVTCWLAPPTARSFRPMKTADLSLLKLRLEAITR